LKYKPNSYILIELQRRKQSQHYSYIWEFKSGKIILLDLCPLHTLFFLRKWH